MLAWVEVANEPQAKLGFPALKWLGTGLKRCLGWIVGGEEESGVLKEKGRAMDAANTLARLEPDRWTCFNCSGDVDNGTCEMLRSCFDLLILKEEGGVRPVEKGVRGSLVDAPIDEAAEWGPLIGFCMSKEKVGFVVGGSSMLEATWTLGK